MATNLFKQWNPLKNNQKSDVAYESDVQRSGGAVSGVHPASTFNKLAYQMSTFIYCLAEAMKNKGYNMSDADPAALTTILEDILTKADQIQSDWVQTDSGQMDYIKNKPTIIDPVQSDWNEADTNSLAFIKNKATVTNSINNAKLMADVRRGETISSNSLNVAVSAGTWFVLAQARLIEAVGANFTLLVNGVLVDTLKSVNYEGAEIYKLMGMTEVIMPSAGNITISLGSSSWPGSSAYPKMMGLAIRIA